MVRYLGGDRQRWEWCCGNCHGFSQQAKGQEGRNFRVQEARRRKMQNMAYFYESMCSRDSWGRTFGDGQCSNQEGGNRSWNGAMPQGWGRCLPFVLFGMQPCLAGLGLKSVV